MRVAVVAGPAPGHAFPAAGLAVALRAAGHDVTVLTGPDWLPALRRDGLAAVELPVPAEAAAGGRGFGYLLWGLSVAMADPVAARLRVCGAEAVVTDVLTVAGGFAAELAGLPYVVLVPHLLGDQSRVLPPPGSGLRPARTPVGRGRDALLRRLQAVALARGAAQRAQARAALGLPAAGGPVARLVATLPGLEPPRPDWPADARLVGPLEWDPAPDGPDLPPGDGPLIVVAGSTAAGAPADLGAAVLAAAGTPAARRAGWRVAVSRLDPCPDPHPAPWATAGPGRQEPLLAEARRTGGAVVSGGGHGMVAKALVRGLPLVAVPGVGDQRDNAARVAATGAGIAVPARRAGSRELGRALRRVLGDPRHAAAAARVGASGAGLGPAYAAEAVILAVRGGGDGRTGRFPA